MVLLIVNPKCVVHLIVPPTILSPPNPGNLSTNPQLALDQEKRIAEYRHGEKGLFTSILAIVAYAWHQILPNYCSGSLEPSLSG